MSASKAFLLTLIDYCNYRSVILSHRSHPLPECVPTAVSIPYPSISLHALQRLKTVNHHHHPLHQSITYYNTDSPLLDCPDCPAELATTGQAYCVYLQIDPEAASRMQTNPDGNDGGDEDLEVGLTVELLLVLQNGQGEVEEATKELFEALSRCADLHPDPGLDGDAGGEGDATGLMAGLEGATGMGPWITSENAHEFEGQFVDVDAAEVEDDGFEERPSGLGPGAGTTRAREDEERPDINGVDVGGEHGEDTKWQRTG